MKKNLAKKISAGILATFLGIGVGYCDSVWAKDINIKTFGDLTIENKVNTDFGYKGKISFNKTELGEIEYYDGYEMYRFNDLYIRDSYENNKLEINFGKDQIYNIFYGSAVRASEDAQVLQQNKFKIVGSKISVVEINGADSDSKEETRIRNNHLELQNSEIINSNYNLYGGKGAYSYEVIENTVNISESILGGNEGTFDFGKVCGGYGTESGNVSKNQVRISKTEVNSNVNIYGGYLDYGEEKGVVDNNSVEIYGDSEFNGETNIYGGFITVANGGEYQGTINNNSISLSDGKNINFEKVNLYGYALGSNASSSGEISNNNLIINNWTGNVNSINNFNNIEFKTINWEKDGTVLNITGGNFTDLANTGIKVDNETNLVFSGGYEFTPGESMTLVKNAAGIDGIADLNDTFTASAGVAGEVSGIITGSQDSVDMTIEKIGLNNQVELVAENRAVAAAFVNQGTDLINDSLDVLSRDGKYGVKTFAAVHGNRSKYDVNSDLKINGWSSIVGVGNEKNIGNGDFSWGVFYENSSGNYRTYNEFNNEFFRGDGSLVYNGGGIAARFEQDNGVYTEGSLRAGMLKSEMTNALKDGAGNSYGYKSESTYYGAHLGVGKIISLNEATDLDVYGKFFHTYTDGDSFTVANDKFEFDSITSDRLRIGARLTTNKENKFSTYYGLAYEYEFNGDADMRAQNMSAPEQSLKGSSCMAEIGMNYRPSSESPWSFDLSMRGYAGQRDGFSGNVQATYTF